MENKVDEQHQVDVSSASSYNPDPHSQFTTLTVAPTSSIIDMTSAYGQPAVTSYSHDGQYYDYGDWSQQQGQMNGMSSDPAASHHAFFAYGERPDLVSAAAVYPGFAHTSSLTHGPGATPDLYASGATLWSHHHHQHHLHPPPPPPSMVDDPLQVTLTSRYTPTMTRNSASSSGSSTSSPNGKPKRRRVQSVPQRKAANIRERRRMYHLNSAFDELRKRLPAFNYEKRLSRIETLRLAMTYIGFMKDVTMGQDPRKVKLRAGTFSDAGSDLSHVDLESCASDDHEDS